MVAREERGAYGRKFSAHFGSIDAPDSLSASWFETRRFATLLTMRSNSPSDKVCVARIGAAHGVRGEVKLWSFTQDPAAVASYGPLETQDGTRRFEIEALRPAKDHFVARITGVANRDAAEKLRNLELYIPRARLPEIEEAETFYHADLVGLQAVTKNGETIGTVSAIHNFGASDVIEIKPAAGGEPLLVPFTDATVPEIDFDARYIVVVPPGETE
jgi:16S rRNA processing protein RimM